MPLFADSPSRIMENLEQISNGIRPPLITVGYFTDRQFLAINSARKELTLAELEINEIVFIGRHLYESRSNDGYSLADMLIQITSALHDEAIAIVGLKMSCLRNHLPRNDGYGNRVMDQAIFEMTARKPRAELYSVIPKNDYKKPLTQKVRLGGPLEDDPG